MSSNATSTELVRHDGIPGSQSRTPEPTSADLALDDLLVQDGADIKGGPGGGFVCTWCGVNGGNHNENLVADTH